MKVQSAVLPAILLLFSQTCVFAENICAPYGSYEEQKKVLLERMQYSRCHQIQKNIRSVLDSNQLHQGRPQYFSSVCPATATQTLSSPSRPHLSLQLTLNPDGSIKKIEPTQPRVSPMELSEGTALIHAAAPFKSAYIHEEASYQIELPSLNVSWVDKSGKKNGVELIDCSRPKAFKASGDVPFLYASPSQEDK